MTATTWNPADKSAGFTLSEGDLRAAATGGGNIGVRANFSATTGKFYFEALANVHTDNTYDGVGVVKMSQALNNVFQGTGGAELIKNGGIDVAGAVILANYVGGGSTHVYCVAVDLTAKKFWGRVDGGNWNNDAGANPATGVGGIDISAAGSINAAECAPYVASSTTTIDVTANFGASAYAFTPPVGFGNWNSDSGLPGGGASALSEWWFFS